MRFVSFELGGQAGLGMLDASGEIRGWTDGQEAGFPLSIERIVRDGVVPLSDVARRLQQGEAFSAAEVRYRPPFGQAGKILCVGLNYVDHSKESGYELPAYPTIFGRFATSLIGHNAPMIRPRSSEMLDFEGELVAVIGKPGRHIARTAALDHVLGYSIFNDGSVRDFQHRTPQWTVGKNFDGTGAFGPVFVTADELPRGAKGLRLETRLNGRAVQSASTDDLVFGVAELVSLLSEAMTLEAGDVIVTGTPAGVGAARKPPLFMFDGDLCEVEIEGLGVLRNPVKDE